MNARAICLVTAGLFIGTSGLLPGLTWAQSNTARPPTELDAKPIGKILNVTGFATIEHTGAVIVQANLSASGDPHVKADDAVYRGDLVQTGADGAVDIVFADGTTFKVSSNARMALNEFVYDPAGNSNSTLFNLSKGSFTFLAGAIAKSGSMKVDTPVGTMGIRGTAPHVEILEDGTVKFSTLIEENKNANDDKSSPAGAPSKRARNQPLPDTSATLKADRELDKTLKICNGC